MFPHPNSIREPTLNTWRRAIPRLIWGRRAINSPIKKKPSTNSRSDQARRKDEEIRSSDFNMRRDELRTVNVERR
ncbi:hypothetical protein L484_010051 [Morus notabilis]|uniref:Uncharacterized protein n=1 Tax=Morus notabilis TaxID=981085 RepID=W9RU17_9ROSA|nr:hypothetical protein L484_010051 [Morus notabilis]